MKCRRQQHRKYATHCSAARRGPSHSHGQRAQKFDNWYLPSLRTDITTLHSYFPSMFTLYNPVIHYALLLLFCQWLSGRGVRTLAWQAVGRGFNSDPLHKAQSRATTIMNGSWTGLSRTNIQKFQNGQKLQSPIIPLYWPTRHKCPKTCDHQILNINNSFISYPIWIKLYPYVLRNMFSQTCDHHILN